MLLGRTLAQLQTAGIDACPTSRHLRTVSWWCPARCIAFHTDC